MAINKTAELVRHWAEFEAQHTDADLDDFCRYYLINKREKQSLEGFLGGNVPPGRDQMLIKLMGRVTAMFVICAEHAFKEIGLEQFLEFTYLNTIHSMNNPKKTDVINDNFMELSSGLLLIDRLKKRGWVKEQTDKTDKRSKRLELNPAGIEVLFNSYMILEKLCNAFFKDLASDDAQLCLHLLTPLEIKHASTWQKNKANGFKEMLNGIKA
jgi:DNA-binding MarR family transcriptional regulator